MMVPNKRNHRWEVPTKPRTHTHTRAQRDNVRFISSQMPPTPPPSTATTTLHQKFRVLRLNDCQKLNEWSGSKRKLKKKIKWNEMTSQTHLQIRIRRQRFGEERVRPSNAYVNIWWRQFSFVQFQNCCITSQTNHRQMKVFFFSSVFALCSTPNTAHQFHCRHTKCSFVCTYVWLGQREIWGFFFGCNVRCSPYQEMRALWRTDGPHNMDYLQWLWLWALGDVAIPLL